MPSAIAANSIGVNISRALGPALGGVTISWFGIVAPFWLNAISNLGIVGALLWWRESKGPGTLLPAERFGRAISTGLRHARSNPHLRGTMIRAAGFFLFASAYWALLPLVARTQIVGGPELYGVLLGVIGIGAVGGAFFLPALKRKLGPDRLMALGTVGQAIAMVLYGLAHEPVMALAASCIAGASWIAALATLTVSAKVALPDWVRGRGLALYTTVFFGCLTLGSAVWGEVAAYAGLPAAHFPRRRRRDRSHSADLALETADRLRASTLHRRCIGRCRLPVKPSMNDRGPVLVSGRIPHPATGPRRLPRSHRQARAWTPPRRRLCLGRVRRPADAGHALLKRSLSNCGWSICASMSASPTPIDWCRKRSIDLIWPGHLRSRISSPQSLSALRLLAARLRCDPAAAPRTLAWPV